jgi:DNA segregation ATPase FtsK/SpoIIIE, S-DNA-T family
VATRQRTTAKKSSKKAPSSRSSSAKSRSGSSRSTSGKGSAKARASADPSPFRLLFDGHGHDVWGLGLILLAVLSALGIYLGAAGPVGSGLAAGAATVVGSLDVLVPIALAAAGVLLIRGPRRAAVDLSEDAGAEADEVAGAGAAPHGSPVLRVAGAVLALVVVAGILDVFRGEGLTVSRDGIDAYAGAGGLIGAGAAGALARLLGRWGALAVLVGLGVVAVSLLTGRTFRQLWQITTGAVRPVAVRCGAWLSDLFRVGTHTVEDDDAQADGTRPALYDQDVDAPAGRPPRRSRPRKESGPTVHVADPDPVEPEQLEIALPPGAAGSPWRLPPAKLLSVSGRRNVDTKAVEERGRVLEAALAEHGVQTRLVGMVVGPTVTRYELELGVGVKVARVTTLNKDIAYAMASPDVRIIAPIPGRQAIGVEVPNEERQVVNLGDILASEEARRATHPLEVGVGRDINGTSVLMNLATMPHLLIAGQTGAGKSSCINSIITSVMMRSTPDQVRMILIDPKRVELTQYNRIPHLLTQVVTNPKKAANALHWAVKEMERRYDLLSEVGVRDITGYNAAFDRGDLVAQLGEEREFQRLPFVLIVVDELADLMMVAPRDVEDAICRIAQMARAVGIHLVIATQRPSVNVITGVIKANVPARLAFAVASATDSKVILDQAGAERLVGRGDMLLLGGSSSSPQRIQGAWVEEQEVSSIVATWRKQAPEVEAHFVAEVQGSDESSGSGAGGGGGGGDDDDDLLKQAMELVVRSQLGSTSMLQRKLKVGFARAGRLMDLLEQRGVVGPSEGSKARAVLMTPDELDELIENGEF